MPGIELADAQHHAVDPALADQMQCGVGRLTRRRHFDNHGEGRRSGRVRRPVHKLQVQRIVQAELVGVFEREYDRVGPLRTQGPGRGIGAVVQVADGPFDGLARVAAGTVPVVEEVGDRLGRDTGALGHVAHGRAIRYRMLAGHTKSLA